MGRPLSDCRVPNLFGDDPRMRAMREGGTLGAPKVTSRPQVRWESCGVQKEDRKLFGLLRPSKKYLLGGSRQSMLLNGIRTAGGKWKRWLKVGIL